MKLLFNILSVVLLVSTTISKGQSTEVNKGEIQKSINMKRQVLIDKFFVPKNAIDEFTQRMNYNRNFIKKLPGFIKDEVYGQTDKEGNLTIITVATWENQDSIDNAKSAVLGEYKRIGFNPAEFYQRLEIKMERGIYYEFKE